MKDTLIGLNQLIKEEANEILNEKGLLSILKSYGEVHITGSYELNLMTWRDLDIYLEIENITETSFFVLGGKIAELLKPVKMSFRNETIAKTKGLPNGMYWGTYLGDERNGDWKIDVWAVTAAECQRLLKYCTLIKNKLTPVNSLQILYIKSKSWKNSQFRRSFVSTDIYNAVLERGITDMEEFEEYLKTLHGTK